MAHYLAHIMFLSCLTCAMIRYNMQIFSYIENSPKWIWKVGIILRRKINKRRGSRDSKKIFLVAHILAHVCQKLQNMCQTGIVYY